MIKSDVDALITPEGQLFLSENLNNSPENLLLKYRGKIDNALLHGVAEQLRCTSKLLHKQPRYADVNAMVELSLLEQSTAEEVAQYRLQFISGKTICDCTGGLGVDSFAFATQFESVTFCEIDESRLALFEHNRSLFQNSNITTQLGDSMDFLKNRKGETFDWIFLDPARRDNSGKRFITLDACSPDVLANADLLRKSARNIAIKLSPAFDISEITKLFPDLSRIVVVSLDGEVREILITIEKYLPLQPIQSVSISNGSVYSLSENRELTTTVGECNPGDMLFEPDPAIIKAGIISSLAGEYDLNHWAYRSIFLLGKKVHPEFVGRQFTISEIIPWQRKKVGKYLKQNGISEAAIIRRDFPLAPEELRKMYKLRESSTQFLIFTVNSDGKRVVIICKKWYK